jgi:hypothetical protein
MKVSPEGIRQAAYARWEHRGRCHGFDRQDWIAAELQARFELNYQVVAADRLDGNAPRVLGAPTSRRCRFCGGANPRVEFSDSVAIFPANFGPGSPLALDQCEDCASGFAEEIDPALLRFVGPYLRPIERDTTPASGISVAAFKGLVKLALSVMPLDQLDEFEETIDWIGNPDHDFDLSVFRGMACVIHQVPTSFPASWSALAQRMDDGEAWPSMLFFLGLKSVILQIAVPMGRLDDELEIPASSLPDVLPPIPFGLGFDPITRLVLPITSQSRAAALRATRLVA